MTAVAVGLFVISACGHFALQAIPHSNNSPSISVETQVQPINVLSDAKDEPADELPQQIIKKFVLTGGPCSGKVLSTASVC